jgi:CRISPR-associated protein Csm3
MSEFNKLEKKVFIKGVIVAKTGLHIGGSSIGMEIGGADKIVIRNPVDNQPYIPGSSLKGKMRSLAEKITGDLSIKTKSENGREKIVSCGPTSNTKGWIGKIFGVSAAEKDNPPTRLIVRDAKLINEKELANSENTDMPYSEVKTEVSIARLTAVANPRQIERVPAGAQFELDLVLNVYENDSEKDNIEHLFDCLRYVQDDYLGGHGTRGYGKVGFQIEKITYKDMANYRDNDDAKEYNDVKVPNELGRHDEV